MGDFEKRYSGQPLSVSANEWNSMQDAAQAYKQGGNPTSPVGVGSKPNTLTVCNNGSTSLEAFKAVVFTSPVSTPSNSDVDNTQEFKNRPVMNVSAASSTTPLWGVLQQDLPPNGIGQAVIYGSTVCRVNLLNVQDRFVDITSGAIPRSAGTGFARLLWVAGGVGAATATGEQWAMVLVGAPSLGVIRVKCTNDLGHAQANVKAKRLDVSSAVTGEEFDVVIVHHTTLNDIFWAYPVATGTTPETYSYIQFGYPAVRSQFMVLQINDGSGSPQAIDWDYPKGHN